jgi:hypothetical protein
MSKVFPDKCLQIVGKYIPTDIELSGSVSYERIKELPTEKDNFIPSEDISRDRQKILLDKLYGKLSEFYDTNYTSDNVFKSEIEAVVPELKNVKIRVFKNFIRVDTGLQNGYVLDEKQVRIFKDILEKFEDVLEKFDEDNKNS